MKNLFIKFIVFFFIGITSLIAQEDFEDDIDDFTEPISSNLSFNWLIFIALLLFTFLYLNKNKSHIKS
ncbi:MAG: hypothetical protein ACK4K1_05040 [Flavobacterium sp.]